MNEFKIYKDDERLSSEYDVLHIIFGSKHIEWMMFIKENENMPRFKDIVKLAESKGYIGGVIRVIAESALHGDIFMYGNVYGYDEDGKPNINKPLWYKQGETKGYVG